METCKIEGYGIPTWGPSRQTRGLLATGTFAKSEGNESYLRISQYNAGSPEGLQLHGVT